MFAQSRDGGVQPAALGGSTAGPYPRTGPISLSPGGGGSWVCAGLGFVSNIFGIRKKQPMWTWCRGGMLRSAGWPLGWQPLKEHKSVPGGEIELGESSTSPQTEG